MNGIQILLFGVILAAFMLLGGIWVFQTYGAYRFDQTRQSPDAFGLTTTHVLSFTSEDGTPVTAWLALPAPGYPVIFSFYGNYAAIGPSMQRLSPLLAEGYGIVMLQYRGAGGSPGHPSEAGFARDARALYDQFDALAGQQIAPDLRVLHGFSLGAGVGSRLAVERSFAAVVLEAAPSRGCLYYQTRYHGFPLCRLMWAERYDIIDRIGAITAPKLFVHGAKDAAIPVSQGRALFAAASEPKAFVELAMGGHADLASHGLIEAMDKFLHQQFE